MAESWGHMFRSYMQDLLFLMQGKKEPKSPAPERRGKNVRQAVASQRKKVQSAHRPPRTAPQSQNDLVNLEDFARDIPKKPLTSDISELPQFVKVLTAPNEVLNIGYQVRETIAVLDLGDNNAACIAVADSFGNQAFRTIVRKTENLGYIVTDKLRAKVIVINQINDMALVQQPDSQNNRRKREWQQDLQGKSSPIMLFEEIVKNAAREEASDIHVFIRYANDNDKQSTGTVMFRVHGSLVFVDRHPSYVLRNMISVCYTSPKITDSDSRGGAAKETFNDRQFQNCMMNVTVDGRKIELRYQHYPVKGGINAAIRVLTNLKDNPEDVTLRSLGYESSQVYQLELATRRAHGVIILAGVTGSGKTTTLKTLLGLYPEENKLKNTVTIEDPPEYKLYGVSQLPVLRKDRESKEEINPFARAMKNLLRSDVDRVMVGEIRDADSAEALQAMVQTGHECFVAIHAQSAIECVARLTANDIGMDRGVICSPNFLNALVYQKLLKILCPECKVPALEELPETILVEIERFGINPSKVFVKSQSGCKHCKGRGTVGRTVCAEIILPDREMLRLLRDKEDLEAEIYWRKQRTALFDSPDMRGKTAFEHALYKMSQGFVDPQDVQLAFEAFQRYQIVESGNETTKPKATSNTNRVEQNDESATDTQAMASQAPVRQTPH